MPPATVVARLIAMMVGRKLVRNPNTYASLLGLLWSLVSFRYLEAFAVAAVARVYTHTPWILIMKQKHIQVEHQVAIDRGWICKNIIQCWSGDGYVQSRYVIR
jgi:hypothetical protein